MTTTRRDFVRSASIVTTGLSLAGASRVPAVAGDEPSGLNILILGGTGFLGPAVVEEAVRRGHQMTLFNRGKTNPHLFPDLEKLRGDREQGIQALEKAVDEGRRWDVVIDTSAYIPAHVEASSRLVAEFARQYVILSTVGVYGDHSIPADESSEVAIVDDEWVDGIKTIRDSLENYAAMKARCEKAVENAMPDRVTVIRPGLLIGPMDRSDRFTYWAVRVFRGGEVLAPGDGTDPVQLVDVRDLAIWILDCIEDNLTGVFNAISPKGHWTMAEVLHGIKGAFSTDARFAWVDTDFLEKQEVAPWTDLPVWIPAQGELAAFHLVNTEKAVAAGLRFRPLAETARDTVTWCNETKGADYEFGDRAGISRDREVALLNAWHARNRGD